MGKLDPFAEESFQQTIDAQVESAAQLPEIAYVPVADQLDYYGGFLGDHLHLGGPGHRRVAALTLTAIRSSQFVNWPTTTAPSSA